MDRIIQASESEFLNMVRLAVREELQSFNPGQSEQKPPATKKETAKHLGISIPTLDQLEKTGQLKPFRIGRAVRFRWDDINAYILRK